VIGEKCIGKLPIFSLGIGAVGHLALFAAVLLCTCALQAQSTTPPEWQERWDTYLNRTFDWKRVGALAAETAFDQTFQLRRCGRPPYCFPEDFGGSLARRTAHNTIELGVGALLHEDLRRRPSGRTGIRRRATFALLHAPLARGADGSWEPAYGRFAGTAGAVVVSSAWRGKPITAERMGEALGWSFTSYFQDALMAEFEPDLRRVGFRFARRLMRHGRPDSLHEPAFTSAPGTESTPQD